MITARELAKIVRAKRARRLGRAWGERRPFLRQLRLGAPTARLLRLVDVARAVGTSAATLSRVERSGYADPALKLRLAKFFGRAPEDIW